MYAASPTLGAASDRPAPAVESVAEALRATHDAWIVEAHRFLDLITDPGADFWTRWSAIRYLDDEFRRRHREERALIEELGPSLDPEVAERLRRGGDRIFRVRLELDRLGRRRGTGAEVAGRASELLTQLAVWCAEIELAVESLTRSVPPDGAAGLDVHPDPAEAAGH